MSADADQTQSVDFKAELRNPAAAVAQCKQIAGDSVDTDRYEITDYRISDGSMLRSAGTDGTVTWIRYHRAEGIGPRRCAFTILTEAEARQRFGATPPPVRVTFTLERRTWQLANILIHVDTIEGLGNFIEFQAEVTSQFDDETCCEQIDELRDAYGPILGEPIGVSYATLAAGA